MIKLPDEQTIRACQKDPNWDFGNEILYNLCRDNFGHSEKSKILAKVWLIGRSYSVAIERRKNKKSKEETSEDFYINTVATRINWKRLDEQLSTLRKYERLTSENMFAVLKTHSFLTSQLNKITELNKRSFSSKYLHFHLPELFVIYDSRALSALRRFISRVPEDAQYLVESDEVDTEYAKFACKCLELKRQISDKYGIELKNRHLDNLLTKS